MTLAQLNEALGFMRATLAARAARGVPPEQCGVLSLQLSPVHTSERLHERATKKLLWRHATMCMGAGTPCILQCCLGPFTPKLYLSNKMWKR